MPHYSLARLLTLQRNQLLENCANVGQVLGVAEKDVVIDKLLFRHDARQAEQVSYEVALEGMSVRCNFRCKRADNSRYRVGNISCFL
jgi:hypothetical protein